MLKNSIQAVLTENGFVLSAEEKKLLMSKDTGLYFLEKLDISEASRISIRLSMEILCKVQEQKEHLAKEIFYAGKPFEKKESPRCWHWLSFPMLELCAGSEADPADAEHTQRYEL